MRFRTLIVATTLCVSLIACATQVARRDDQPRVVVERLFDAFNRHDADALAALYTSDAVLISPDHSAPLHGAAGVRSVYAELFAQFPDIRDRVVGIIAQDDHAAVEFVSTGCMADHVQCLELPIATVLTLRGGRIARDVSYFAPPGR